MDSAGNLYGTTYNGGAFDFGTVFKIDASGIYSVLHDFDGASGSNPYGPLALDSAGSLYGTTSTGGASGLGAVFEIDTASNYLLLHDFAGGSSDGSTPYSGIVNASSGALFGTTFNGGADDTGTIFEIERPGDFVLKYSFTAGSDGGDPVAGPVIDSAYALYVSASTGGYAVLNYGTILKYDSEAQNAES